MNEVAGDELIDGKKENWPAQDGLRETDYQVFRDTDDTMINVELQSEPSRFFPIRETTSVCKAKCKGTRNPWANIESFMWNTEFYLMIVPNLHSYAMQVVVVSPRPSREQFLGIVENA